MARTMSARPTATGFPVPSTTVSPDGSVTVTVGTPGPAVGVPVGDAPPEGDGLVPPPVPPVPPAGAPPAALGEPVGGDVAVSGGDAAPPGDVVGAPSGGHVARTVGGRAVPPADDG